MKKTVSWLWEVIQPERGTCVKYCFLLIFSGHGAIVAGNLQASRIVKFHSLLPVLSEDRAAAGAL